MFSALENQRGGELTAGHNMPVNVGWDGEGEGRGINTAAIGGMIYLYRVSAHVSASVFSFSRSLLRFFCEPGAPHRVDTLTTYAAERRAKAPDCLKLMSSGL